MIQLSVKDRVLLVEVVADEAARNLGLMGRPNLPENRGMLFIHPRPQKLAFWMRNTLIPLSIAFLDESGKILQIEHMKPKDETRTVSKNIARYALEVNQGWFERNGIAVGDSFADFAGKVSPFRVE